MNHNKLIVCPLCARILKGEETKSQDQTDWHNETRHPNEEIARVYEWSEEGLDEAYEYAKGLMDHPEQTREQHERLLREFMDARRQME